MKSLLQVACILLITGCLTSAFTPVAHAQLASTVDDRGNVIYINGDAPKPAPAANAARASGAAKPSGAAANGKAAAEATDQPGVASENRSAAPATSAAENGSGIDRTSRTPAALSQAVEESAQRHHVDPALVRAVISTESNWNTGAVSSKGAQGLMQIIPATAQSLGLSNPFDPKANIDAGVRYLSMLLSRYNGDVTKALAAYNAGPGAVDRFGGVPNYRETQNYVHKVTSTYTRPGSERQPRAYDEPAPIYRTVDETGRTIFVNE